MQAAAAVAAGPPQSRLRTGEAASRRGAGRRDRCGFLRLRWLHRQRQQQLGWAQRRRAGTQTATEHRRWLRWRGSRRRCLVLQRSAVAGPPRTCGGRGGSRQQGRSVAGSASQPLFFSPRSLFPPSPHTQHTRTPVALGVGAASAPVRRRNAVDVAAALAVQAFGGQQGGDVVLRCSGTGGRQVQERIVN